MTKSNHSETLCQLAKCVRALDDKKAFDLQIIRVADVSSLTDYVVLATATSEPHLRALRNELSKLRKADKVRMIGVDYTEQSGWLVLDAFDFMVHVFLPSVRDAYRMEGLWRNCPQIDAATLLASGTERPAQARAAAPEKKPVRKTPAKKTAKPAAKKVAKKIAKAPAKKIIGKTPRKETGRKKGVAFLR